MKVNLVKLREINPSFDISEFESTVVRQMTEYRHHVMEQRIKICNKLRENQ